MRGWTLEPEAVEVEVASKSACLSSVPVHGDRRERHHTFPDGPRLQLCCWGTLRVER